MRRNSFCQMRRQRVEEVVTSGRTGMKTAVSAGMEVELSGAVFTCRLVVGGLVGGWRMVGRKVGWV